MHTLFPATSDAPSILVTSTPLAAGNTQWQLASISSRPVYEVVTLLQQGYSQKGMPEMVGPGVQEEPKEEKMVRTAFADGPVFKNRPVIRAPKGTTLAKHLGMVF